MSDPHEEHIEENTFTEIWMCSRCGFVRPVAEFCKECSEITHVSESGDQIWKERICVDCCYHEDFDAESTDHDEKERDHQAKLEAQDRKCERGDM